MKKLIQGKSYNTEYDSEFICQYAKIVDGWSDSCQRIYRKKSTGEYFEYSKWSEWNDGWNIELISEDEVNSVVKKVKSGMTHKYCAVLEDFPGTKDRGSFWGTEDDDPWHGIKVVEKRKKEMEENKKKGIAVIRKMKRCEVTYLYNEEEEEPTGEVYIFFTNDYDYDDDDSYFDFVVKCDCGTAYKTMVECLYNYGYPKCDLNNKYESLLDQPAVKEFLKKMGCTPYPKVYVEGIGYQYFGDSLEIDEIKEIYRELSHKK